MKEVIKYLGALLTVVGVIILSIAVFNETQTNTKLVVSLIFIVVGFFGHILLNRLLK